MAGGFQNILKIPELRKRILITFALLLFVIALFEFEKRKSYLE